MFLAAVVITRKLSAVINSHFLFINACHDAIAERCALAVPLDLPWRFIDTDVTMLLMVNEFNASLTAILQSSKKKTVEQQETADAISVC